MSMQGGNLGTATFYITGNASGGTNAVNQMNNSLATLEQAATQNWWGLRNLGMAFAALPALVGAGTAAAIRSAVQWEDAMAGVARTNNLAGESLDRMDTGLKNMAMRLPTAASDILAIAEAAGALGVEEGDVLNFTETVANFAAVTDVSAQDAATNLARIAGLTGVSGAAWDNLASSIATTGVETAATESDILALANRIAGAAGIVGLTADEVVGLAAATRSAGVQTEAGGTAIQKTFLDINSAVRSNGDEIEGWAALANMSVEDFRNTFQNSAADAFTAVIQNMGELNRSGANVIGMLDAVGITEQRQIRTLLALMQAQDQNVNSNLKLSEILGISQRNFENTGRYAGDLGDRYDTVSKQIDRLKNIVIVAGAGFGEYFLPAIRAVVDVLGYMIQGFAAAPGPVKAIAGVLLGLVTILSSLAAVAFLVGPRILLISNTLRQLTANAGGAVAATSTLTAVNQGNAIATARAVLATNALANALTRQERAALLTAVSTGNAANANSILAGSALNAGAGAAASAGGFAVMMKWLGRLGKFALIAITILTLLASVMAIFGKKQAGQAKEAQKAQQPNNKLVKILTDQKKAAAGAGDAWVKNQKAYKQAQKVTDSLGISQDRLLNVVKGTAGQSEANLVIDKLRKSYEGGNEAAKDAISNIGDLNKVYSRSAQEAFALGGAADRAGTNIGELTDDTKESAKAAKEAAKAHNKMRDALEAIAQAHSDYIQATIAQVQANFALQDATKALTDARNALERQNEEIATAERAYASALDAHEEALQKVIDAERDLASAAERQNAAVEDAVDDLADAQDSYADSLIKIRDLEEDLAELRAGPSLQDLLKATNDLRRAQTSLRDSTQLVADAEWQLQHLREEGASARDILDAENTLADARLKVSESQESVNDAEEKLAELRDDTLRQEKIADLEREIADARRESQAQAHAITQAERDLNAAREDAANNVLIADAERDLAEARRQVGATSQSILDAERELVEARDNTDLLRDVAKAENDLKGALIGVAQANVEVLKQQTLMNGGTWDAGDAAHALAVELGRVSENIPDEGMRNELQGFMDVLAAAPDVPAMVEETADALGGAGDAFGGGIQDALDSLEGFKFEMPPMELEFPDFADAVGNSMKGMFKRAIAGIAGFVAGFLVRRLIQAIVVGLIGGVGAVTGGVAIVAGIIIGLLVEWLVRKALDADWGKIGKAIVDGLKEGWNKLSDFGDWLDKWFTRNILDPILDFFGISSPSKLMTDIGEDIIRGLIRGIGNLASETFQKITGFITGIKDKFTGAGSWLYERGRELIIGIWNGIVAAKDWFLGQLGNVGVWIKDRFNGAITFLSHVGKELITGIWNGMVATKNWLVDQLGNVGGWIRDRFNGALTFLSNVGKDLIRGLWNGIWSMKDWFIEKLTSAVTSWIPGPIRDALGMESPSKVTAEIGRYVVQGLQVGMDDQFPKLGSFVAKQAVELSENLASNLDTDMRKFSPFGIDAFTGNGSFAMTASGTAANPASGAITNNYYDTFDLDAITTADPEEIVNAYVWQKRVRTRS